MQEYKKKFELSGISKNKSLEKVGNDCNDTHNSKKSRLSQKLLKKVNPSINLI